MMELETRQSEIDTSSRANVFPLHVFADETKTVRVTAQAWRARPLRGSFVVEWDDPEDDGGEEIQWAAASEAMQVPTARHLRTTD